LDSAARRQQLLKERSAAGYVILAGDAARTQTPALVDLGDPPSSGHATATTIAAASCLEGM
jgi:hypothetical protein